MLIWLLTLSLVSSATATAAALMFRWCRLRGSSSAAAAFASFAYALGTPIMWWSTTFFGHATASALLLIGFVTFSESLTPSPVNASGRNQIERIRAVMAIFAGFVLGLSFMVEFTAGPAVAIISVCCGTDALLQRISLRRIVPTFLLSGVGLLCPMFVIGVYNAMAFGSPLHLGYASVNGFPGMQSGFFGISAPDLHVARLLLIGQFRGLLFLSPILWIVPLGIIVAVGQSQWRVVAIGAGLIFTWYWLMNAGYYYWWGGYSTGPRQLVPGLSLLLIPLAPLWDRLTPSLRWLALLLLIASIFTSVILAALQIATPEWTWQPFADIWLPMLKKHSFPRLISNTVGIGGLWGFMPLLAVWAACGLPFVRSLLTSAQHGHLKRLDPQS